MIVKHVGKHGDRKVAIVFREVPGEEHMALVVYPETLPVQMHDALMRTIEGAQAQTAENLGDALFRELFPDGRPMLQTFHSEGMLKKVQTKQVVVTPNPSKMEAEARGLLAESARLQKEAAIMSGAVPETSSTTAKSKRGRPSNASKAVADAAN